MTDDLYIRTEIFEDDIEKIVRYHNDYYAENYGFNHDFGRYVEEPLNEFFTRKSPRERIWFLEDNNGFVLEEEHVSRIWGRELVEQKFVKQL